VREGRLLRRTRVHEQSAGCGNAQGHIVRTDVVAGEVFALIYYAIFAAIDTGGWLVGALFGLLHGVVSATALVNILLPVVHPRMGSTLSAADSAPLLEPPGFLMRNYGRGTPIATVLAHIAYGAIVGGLASIAA